ncbi:TPA: ribonuclease HII [Candidatus Woesearchaeota archaeon]|nr:ribonuclease HII [Candidatus Woesearchaeota archaeon]
MVLVCGIDEAGKGCIIGPLVMAGILTDDAGVEELKKIEVKDSKLLSAGQRQQLFGKIIDIVESYKIIPVTPAEIDAAVQSTDGMNLNWLEAHKAADIVNFLKPEKAIVDCPSPNIKAYRQYLLRLVDNKKMDVIVEHKADVNWPAVSAASILAKVTRDAEVEKIRQAVGDDFGSGYMHDPKTVEFFKKGFEAYPGIFRKSWAPYRKLASDRLQRRIGEFQESNLRMNEKK